MKSTRGGLGRGLSALLSDSGRQTLELSPEMLIYCPLDQLVVGQYQPRKVFDPQRLAELSESIQNQGLLQPLLVRKISPNQYEILAGERRWRAAKMAGLERLPVLLRQVDDRHALGLALIENLQRDALSAVEHAQALQRLCAEFSLTHQEVAKLLSTSRTSVSNHLRLLKLHPQVLAMLESKAIDMGHARALLSLDASSQLKVAEKIVAQQLSVRDTEALVNRINNKATQHPLIRKSLPYPVQDRVAALSAHLNVPVKIKSNASGQGTLVIHYQDWAGCEQILSQILDT